MEHYTRQINKIAATIPEIEKIFLINGVGGGGCMLSNDGGQSVPDARAGGVVTPCGRRGAVLPALPVAVGAGLSDEHVPRGVAPARRG